MSQTCTTKPHTRISLFVMKSFTLMSKISFSSWRTRIIADVGFIGKFFSQPFQLYSVPPCFVTAEGGIILSVDLVRYSMQLAMLKQLLTKGLITEKEYSQIKLRLMSDYKIPSAVPTGIYKNS